MLKKSFMLSTLLSVFTLSTSILDASALKNFKETLSIPEDFSILTHPTFQKFAQKNPRQVVGLDQIDLDFINSMKKKYDSLSDRERSKMITIHDDACIPQAHKVAKFITTIDPEGENVKITDLLDEIHFMVSKKKVSPVWTLQLSARLAFAISTPSDDELDLFRHTLDKKSKETLKEPEDLSTIIQSVLSYTGEVSILSKYTDSLSHVWHEDMERLFETHPSVPLPEIIHPVFGESIISLPVLNALAAENVTLMGVPTEDKKISAHGIKGHADKPGASIAAFLSHDALHHLLITENKKNTLYRHMHRKTDEAVRTGESAEHFFEQYISYARVLYKSIHTLFQLTMIELMNTADKTEKSRDFRKAMIGQFYMTHEYPGFNASTLDETTATGVVGNLTKATLGYFEDPSIWESPNDPLLTSPHDGATLLEDKEIVELFITQINEKKIKVDGLKRYTSYTYSSGVPTVIHTEDQDPIVDILADTSSVPAVPNIEAVQSIDTTNGETTSTNVAPSNVELFDDSESDDGEYVQHAQKVVFPIDKIYMTEVKRSPRFIDVIIKMKDGNVVSHSYPTNYHKWLNLDGTLGLLAYAGITIEKPELPTDLAEARDLCAQLLSRTSDSIKEQINHFETQAVEVFNQKNSNLPGESIEEAYKIWTASLMAPVNEGMTNTDNVENSDGDKEKTEIS